MPDINSLYAFIERADTPERAAVAERWFRERREAFSAQEFDALMQALSHRWKEIFKESWAKINAYESRMLLVAENTGEIIAEI